MKLYKRVKRAYAISCLTVEDAIFAPKSHFTDWVDDDSTSDAALIEKIRKAHNYSINFSYGIGYDYVPYMEVYKLEQNVGGIR